MLKSILLDTYLCRQLGKFLLKLLIFLVDIHLVSSGYGHSDLELNE